MALLTAGGLPQSSICGLTLFPGWEVSLCVDSGVHLQRASVPRPHDAASSGVTMGSTCPQGLSGRGAGVGWVEQPPGPAGALE